MTPPSEEPATRADAPKPQRLRSLDALRGFDMLWIVGGSVLAKEFAKYSEWGWAEWLSGQMHHPGWEGFTLYDLIFPLFLFLAGVAMPFSLGSKLKNGVSKTLLLRKVAIRAIVLILLGMVYNGEVLQDHSFADMRLCSVLGYIGIAYFFSAVLYLFTDLRHQIIWSVGILFGYWAALMWIHVPGHGAGILTPEGCMTGYIDRSLLPWRFNIHNQLYDSQGLFVTIPAIVTCLFGAFTGVFLRSDHFTPIQKTGILFAAAAVAFLIGALWQTQLFISKELWNPPFIFRCAGYSLALLGLFYGIIDALGIWRWSFFFIVIGTNSILIYLGTRIINVSHSSRYLFNGLIQQTPNELHGLLGSLAFILTWWLALLFLYRHKIFLKV